MAYACNSSIWGAEEGVPQAPGQHELYGKSISQKIYANIKK
jgi:hypothetical protein